MTSYCLECRKLHKRFLPPHLEENSQEYKQSFVLYGSPDDYSPEEEEEDHEDEDHEEGDYEGDEFYEFDYDLLGCGDWESEGAGGEGHESCSV